jgi:ParB-like chromosome segregation protein Spo0J
MSDEARAAKEAAARQRKLDEHEAKKRAQRPARTGDNPVHQVAIADIVIGDRHRRDMGDIAGLAESIEQIGLLQPIGITEDKRLVFGERRVRAYEHLGRAKIPARLVHVDSIARGEHDENVLRQDFTQSERDAIRRAIGHKPEGRPAENSADRPSYAEAAKQAGFDSERTARKVGAVVEHGTPELVEAMDKGDVSIDAAAVMAKQPAVVQQRFVKASPATRRHTVKQLRPKRPKPGLPMREAVMHVPTAAWPKPAEPPPTITNQPAITADVDATKQPPPTESPRMMVPRDPEAAAEFLFNELGQYEFEKLAHAIMALLTPATETPQ